MSKIKMPLNININDFRVKLGETVKLKDWPTKVKPFYKSKNHYKKLLAEYQEQIDDLQDKLYATGQYAFLIILQGMDAAGKDGLIKHVMAGVNPQGCSVTSFKQPSARELKHDFMWRAITALPERGQIGVFNRSYYEDVGIVQVHPAFLNGQNLPAGLLNEKKIWGQRYRSIADSERHLHLNGTEIEKCFVHESMGEQKRRFLERIDDPRKNWKFSKADTEERKFFPAYMKTYGKVITATNTKHAPWYIIPADDKMNARLIFAHITLARLHTLAMTYPETTPQHKRELAAIRRQLVSEGGGKRHKKPSP